MADGVEPPRCISTIAVFCGSSAGATPVYVAAAQAIGAVMVKRNIGLV